MDGMAESVVRGAVECPMVPTMVPAVFRTWWSSSSSIPLKK